MFCCFSLGVLVQRTSTQPAASQCWGQGCHAHLYHWFWQNLGLLATFARSQDIWSHRLRHVGHYWAHVIHLVGRLEKYVLPLARGGVTRHARFGIFLVGQIDRFHPFSSLIIFACVTRSHKSPDYLAQHERKYSYYPIQTGMRVPSRMISDWRSPCDALCALYL